jgi:hypothetical protein
MNAVNRGRESPPPTPAEFTRYVSAVSDAPNEATIIYETSKLLKEYKDMEDIGYFKVFGQTFDAYPHNLEFNCGLPAPRLGMVEGLRAGDFWPFPVKEALGGSAVLIKDFGDSITLPHITGELRGPWERLRTAGKQNTITGAHLVHGRNEALRYIGASDSWNHAAVVSFAINGTQINTYAHFAAKSEKKVNGRLDYHTYLLTVDSLVASFDRFKEGRQQLRNLQDYAKAQSYALRDQLVNYRRANLLNIPIPAIPEEPPRRGRGGFTTPPPTARNIFSAPGAHSPPRSLPDGETILPDLARDTYIRKPDFVRPEDYKHGNPTAGLVIFGGISGMLRARQAGVSGAPAPEKRAAAQPVRREEDYRGVEVITISDDEDEEVREVEDPNLVGGRVVG